MLGFETSPEFFEKTIETIQQCYLQLFVNNASQCRLKGTEQVADDYAVLLDNLKRKFQAQQIGPELKIPPLVENQVVIFLDVDGVCLDFSDETTARIAALPNLPGFTPAIINHADMLDEQFNITTITQFVQTSCWHPFHMQRLLVLCREFDARIVISSNWRAGRTDQQLKNLLDLWGLGDYYYSKTETANGDSRTTQIKNFLELHPQIKAFLILDDNYKTALTQNYLNEFVHCESKIGFDEQAYEQAKAMLQKNHCHALPRHRQA